MVTPSVRTWTGPILQLLWPSQWHSTLYIINSHLAAMYMKKSGNNSSQLLAVNPFNASCPELLLFEGFSAILV